LCDVPFVIKTDQPHAIFTKKQPLRAIICLERESAIPQPRMGETYGCPIEILPKYKHTRVDKPTVPNPTTTTIIPYHLAPLPITSFETGSIAPPSKKKCKSIILKYI